MPSHSKSLNQLLQKISINELQEFIQHYAQKQDNFIYEFEAYFADKFDTGSEEKYKKLIDQIIKKYERKGYLSYREVTSLSSEVDGLLSLGRKSFQNKDFVGTYYICKTLLPEAMNLFINADDSGGHLSSSISDIFELISDIATSAEISFEILEKVYLLVIESLRSGVYYDYGFGDELVPIVEELTFRLGKQKNYLELLDKFIITAKSQSEHESNFFLQCKLNFLKSMGELEAAEEVMDQNLDVEEVRFKRVEQLIEAKDLATARELVLGGIALAEGKGRHGLVSQWKTLLLKIAYLSNDIEEVRSISQNLAFSPFFDLSYYTKWKDTYEEEEWRPIIDAKILDIESKLQHEVKFDTSETGKARRFLTYLGPLYIQEEYWEKLMDLLRKTRKVDLYLNYLPYLKKDFSDELVDLTLQAWIYSVQYADGRSKYRHLALQLKQLLREIPSGDEKVRKTIKMIMAQNPRKPALLDEMGKI